MAKNKNKKELLEDAKQKVLWSLLLEENERQELLQRIENYTEEQLGALIKVFKHSQRRENDVFDTLGEIDPEVPQKIKQIRKGAQKEMLKSAEKAETEDEEAAKLLENL